MINALDLNCNIIALNTKFNREMLSNKKVIFFEKKIDSIKNSILQFEEEFNILKNKNSKYKLPSIYNWDYIANQYLKLFYELTNCQSM